VPVFPPTFAPRVSYDPIRLIDDQLVAHYEDSVVNAFAVAGAAAENTALELKE
jgi:hypothetical protein